MLLCLSSILELKRVLDIMCNELSFVYTAVDNRGEEV